MKGEKKGALDAIAKIIVVILIGIFIGAATITQLGRAGIIDLAALTGNAATLAGTDRVPGGAAATQVPAGQTLPTGQSAVVQGQSPRTAGGTGAAQNAVTVSVKEMRGETIRQTVRLNGNVSSRTEVGIFPDTAGKITSLRKGVGDPVQKGEIIAYIDPSRPGTAYALNPVVSTMAGTIIDLPIEVGGTVATNTSIATVGSLNDLIIKIYVAEKYSALLKTGLPAFVSLASDPEQEYEASVTAVSPVVSAKNRTIETTLTLRGRVPAIKPGMFASVSLIIRQENNTLVLPRNTVKAYNNQQVVYTVDAGNVAHRVPVTAGLSNDTEVQIISGLSPGDLVVVGGTVTDGSRVRIALGRN
ncbi:MAG: efflux RND transporter periplasmic adaptor subunit [Spirochaetaceae bacterium]|jgi:multidrug efflux pump subunit AcrA (membrane-fusion protein)|nr:efflux RND transporter periplasmic adaptor subunit [Spirochaetaceae bacterium]